MTIQDDKYTVIKTDDVLNIEVNRGGELIDPRDCFVIRKGDVLGVTTLFSYIGNITILLELAELGLTNLSEEQYDYLVELADYVTHLANEWTEQTGTGFMKLPD